MTTPRHSLPHRAISLRATLLLLLLSLNSLSGCKEALKIEDPQLKPIQAMIEQNVPIGSTEGAVLQFLSARGYPTENSDKPGVIVAVIRHIDTEKMQPVTARVTFYFDANGKLNTCEIVRTMNEPIPQ